MLCDGPGGIRTPDRQLRRLAATLAVDAALSRLRHGPIALILIE